LIQIGLKNWLLRVDEYKAKYSSAGNTEAMNPNFIVNQISQLTKEGDIVCLDVGQNQMWAAQSFKLNKKQRMLMSGGMGSMGFSLPAAMGAYYASDKKNVIVITGDGGMQMNIQELQTIKRNNIPLKIIILNNNCLGMIRHFQEMYFEGVYAGTVNGYDAPDFCKIGEAYGIKTVRITHTNEIKLLESKLTNDEPLIVDVQLERTTYVIPKLGVNKPIEDQEPLLDREEFNKNMIIKPLEEE